MANPTKGASWQHEAGPNVSDVLQVLDGHNGDVLFWLDQYGALNNNNSPTAPVLISTFGGAPTVSHGLAVEIAHQDFANQAAAITNYPYYTVPASRAGFFRVNWLAKITQVAAGGGASSILGGTNGMQVTYSDGIDGQQVTAGTIGFAGSEYNTLGTQLSGQILLYAASGSPITFTFGYASTGSTPMQYFLHVRLEDM
jgi:hypothetical protein